MNVANTSDGARAAGGETMSASEELSVLNAIKMDENIVNVHKDGITLKLDEISKEGGFLGSDRLHATTSSSSYLYKSPVSFSVSVDDLLAAYNNIFSTDEKKNMFTAWCTSRLDKMWTALYNILLASYGTKPNMQSGQLILLEAFLFGIAVFGEKSATVFLPMVLRDIQTKEESGMSVTLTDYSSLFDDDDDDDDEDDAVDEAQVPAKKRRIVSTRQGANGNTWSKFLDLFPADKREKVKHVLDAYCSTSYLFSSFTFPGCEGLSVATPARSYYWGDNKKEKRVDAIRITFNKNVLVRLTSKVIPLKQVTTNSINPTDYADLLKFIKQVIPAFKDCHFCPDANVGQNRTALCLTLFDSANVSVVKNCRQLENATSLKTAETLERSVVGTGTIFAMVRSINLHPLDDDRSWCCKIYLESIGPNASLSVKYVSVHSAVKMSTIYSQKDVTRQLR